MAGVFHISEEEAARDFAALMRRVRSGEEVVVEESGRPVVVMKRAGEIATAEAECERRTIAEAREILRRGSSVRAKVADPDFGSDMEAVRAIYNAPMDDSKWD
jgi:antitoxin (DNA-binding transcriptional repressor) of toxin-antitoxin stability system